MSFPIPLRFALAAHSRLLSPLLQVINRAEARLIRREEGERIVALTCELDDVISLKFRDLSVTMQGVFVKGLGDKGLRRENTPPQLV